MERGWSKILKKWLSLLWRFLIRVSIRLFHLKIPFRHPQMHSKIEFYSKIKYSKIEFLLYFLSKDSHINNYTVLQRVVNIFIKYVGMLHQNCTVLPLWDFPSSRIFELCARNQLWGSHTHFVAGNFFCVWFQFAIGLELRQYTTRPCWNFFFSNFREKNLKFVLWYDRV